MSIITASTSSRRLLRARNTFDLRNSFLFTLMVYSNALTRKHCKSWAVHGADRRLNDWNPPQVQLRIKLNESFCRSKIISTD
ncbi:unnamed protein product [Tenebrio molitor]|nr:unnamed protein product [Tenebrio molitor]